MPRGERRPWQARSECRTRNQRQRGRGREQEEQESPRAGHVRCVPTTDELPISLPFVRFTRSRFRSEKKHESQNPVHIRDQCIRGTEAHNISTYVHHTPHTSQTTSSCPHAI